MDKAYFYKDAPALVDEFVELTEKFLKAKSHESGQIVNLAIQCERAINHFHEQDDQEAVVKLKECKLNLSELWSAYSISNQ